MLITSAASSQSMAQNSQIWNSLKQSIASSSGFKRWQQEQILSDSLLSNSLDIQVRYYLRETLETLAY